MGKDTIVALRTRPDDEGEVIKAFIDIPDGKQGIVIATLSMQMATDCPGLFEKWYEMLSDSIVQLCKKEGVENVQTVDIKLHEMN